jgi:hypothetical protein
MKKVLTIISLLSLQYLSFAQTSTTQNGTPIENRYGFSFNYFGHKITSPGFQMGVESYLATTKNYNVIGSVFFTNYFVDKNYTAIALNPRIGLRYTANFGLTLESHLGMGYLHRFFQFNEYDVNTNGQLISKGKASQASVMPNLAVGIGYDLRKKLNLQIIYVIRASINYNYPNRHLLFEAFQALETGIVYVPKMKKMK